MTHCTARCVVASLSRRNGLCRFARRHTCRFVTGSNRRLFMRDGYRFGHGRMNHSDMADAGLRQSKMERKYHAKRGAQRAETNCQEA